MITKIAGLFNNSKFDTVLITNWADLFYLTGIEKVYDYWLLLEKSGKMTLLVPEIIHSQVYNLAKTSGYFNKFRIIKVTGVLAGLKSCLKADKINCLGIDPDRITCSTAEKLQKICKIIKIPGLISKYRLIKTPEEIENIRKSCQLISKIYDELKPMIQPGMTEKDVLLRLFGLYNKYNIEPSFDPIIASGPNTAYPHHITSTRKIQKNDIIMVDIGCRYKGYCSDLTRTFFLGKINDHFKRIYNIIAYIQGYTMKKVRPNKHVAELDKIARDFIAEKKLKNKFIHSTGHGIGIEIHESPRIAAKNSGYTGNIRLKPGMIITIEPGVYIPNIFGVRIEDTILVTKTGNDVLTETKS